MEKIRNLVKKIIRESFLSEEYSGDVLYGYHVTSLKNWEEIKEKGFLIGDRAMQGRGFYAFYDYNHAVRYGMKGEIKNPVVIKFSITKPNRFLILNMDIAMEVLGPDEYHLYNQIERYFYGGFNSFFEEVKRANPSMTIEKLRETINLIESDNDEMKQRTLVFYLIPKDLNDRLNIIWNGNYGLEYRINNLDLIKILGYKSLFDDSEVELSIFDKIPDTEEFGILFDFLRQYPRIDSFVAAHNLVDKALMSARNNRDLDYYQKLLDLLERLK